MKAEILKMLRETDSYVSGQELCNKFGVSRTAVWKAINQLKENGYEIEAVQNKGYHLLSAPDVMDVTELESIHSTEWDVNSIITTVLIPRIPRRRNLRRMGIRAEP